MNVGYLPYFIDATNISLRVQCAGYLNCYRKQFQHTTIVFLFNNCFFGLDIKFQTLILGGRCSYIRF